MKTPSRVAIAALVVLAVVESVSGCTRGSGYGSSSNSGSGSSAPSCSQLLTFAVHYVRSDTGDVDTTMEALRLNCSDEYDIAVDYISNSFDSEFRVESCDELLSYGARTEAVELLEQDGLCTFGSAPVATASEWPDGGLGWDQARSHTGTVQRVCGPLISARETDDGTFLNVGRDYPSADRFTFIFWDLYLEPIDPGVTLCGSGEIYLYEGTVAQMEMWDPATLEIWR